MKDLFISHAWEDKRHFVRRLARRLQLRGVELWYDEFSLNVGDSLRGSIDRGLAESRYGAIVLSSHFFAKQWTNLELGAILNQSVGRGGGRVVPIWYKIKAEDVRSHAPLVVDMFALDSNFGIDYVVEKIIDKVRPDLAIAAIDRSEDVAKLPNGPAGPYSFYDANNVESLEWIMRTRFPDYDYGDWLPRILACNHSLGIEHVSSLLHILDDNLTTKILDCIYERLLNRKPDPVGILAFSPYIFMFGKSGIERVEIIRVAAQ